MHPKAAQVASAPATTIEGIWQRHVSSRFADQALSGRRGYGRWGTRDGFPVLYLGRPEESVVIEAYRHLVDPVIDGFPQLTPRVLVSAEVSVSAVLDLRTPAGRASVGLATSDLASDTQDREAYARCQAVAQVAHQLGRHGIVAPAATGRGETLALFVDLLPLAERPKRYGDDELWPELPPDPRIRPRLRVVRDEGA